jgi:hypothetical protein
MHVVALQVLDRRERRVDADGVAVAVPPKCTSPVSVVLKRSVCTRLRAMLGRFSAFEADHAL